MKKSYSTLSGSIAFFLIINGGSLAYLILYISNLFDFKFEVANKTIMTFLTRIENNIDYSNVIFTIFFIATSIYGASSLFFHLLKTGEMIYEEVNDKFTLIKRLTAIIFLTATLFIIELFFILIVIGKHFFSNLFWQILKYIILLFLPYVISICINFFITPHSVKFKEINKGALFTTLFWYIITIGFTIYVNIFTNYKAIYGALTFFIVFMIWIYLLAQGLVIGVILNFYEKEKNTRLLLNKDVNTIIGTPEEDNEKV
jgi:membrane protein